MQGGRVVTGSGSLTATQRISTSIFMQEMATIEGNLNLGGGIVDVLVGNLLAPRHREPARLVRNMHHACHQGC